MNFFAPQVVALLHGAPWRDIASPTPMHFKHICHVQYGLCVMVTNFSSSAYVGVLGAVQMIRSIHTTAPGLQLDATELLRVVDESCYNGNVCLLAPSVVAEALEFQVNFAVDVIAGHAIRAAVQLELVDVGALHGKGEQRFVAVADFLRDAVVRPMLAWQGNLERVLQTLVDQRRISVEEISSVARGVAAASPRVSTHLLPSSALWLQDLRLRCFPTDEPRAPPQAPSAGAPPAAAPTTSIVTGGAAAVLATRDDSMYVETPEELLRKRQRDQQHVAQEAAPKDEAGAMMKKIRKALR